MYFYCLRHPQPAIGPGICYGRTDIGLSENYEGDFLRIKKECGPLIQSGKILRLFSSPLIRCAKPAGDLSSVFNLPLKTDSRLSEINFGRWEGQSYEELWQKDPEYRRWSENWQREKTPGGESLPELIIRVKSFLDDHILNGILLVTHSGVIRTIKHLIDAEDIGSCFSEKIPFGFLIEFKR